MYTVTCVIVSILLGSVAKSVLGKTIGYVCLETVFRFTIEYGSNEYCNRFSQQSAIQFFKPGTVQCPQTCEVTIDGLQGYKNYLGTIVLGIDSFHYRTVCSGVYSSRRTLIIDCSSWEKDKFSISNSEQCEKRNAHCDSWQQMCVCYCNSTNLMVNGCCVKGNLVLNQSCTFNEQCTGSPYAMCLEGRCTCIQGYTANNSVDCVFRIQEYSQANSIVSNTDEGSINPSFILGALFGGIFLGVLVTTGVVFIFLRRFRSNTKKGDTPNVMFVENTAHNAAYVDINRVQETTDSTKQRKIINDSPYPRSVETPEYSNYSGKPRRQPAQEDVYNHLNEKEGRDSDDNYDHASAAVGHSRDLNDYSSVDDMHTKIAAPDDYFTLEPN